MAEENEVKAEASSSAPPPKKSKTGLYLTIIVVQLLVAGFLIWKFVFPEYEEIKTANDVALGRYEAPQAKGESKDEDDGELKELGPLYNFENLTVNPKGSRGMRYAVVGLSAELESEEDSPLLDQYKTVLIDNYIAYMRKHTMKELAEESTMDSLKIGFKTITNELLGREVVKNVYFTQFVLQ
ncbi:MAG TPA: hypothetical protein ENJ10_12295 [Caldithrix abyssi]|uniref:Flagellar protein FliL n=1 Tax=Caldithrix abyssi TaxID=187145 RepID=A0A7V1LNX8_CALAY|nr:hypothetical protein [Caldithrix abyssi]